MITTAKLAAGIFVIVLFSSTTFAQFTGVVRAREEVTIRSEISGIVDRIAVREGQSVKEGELLVELRNQRQKISVDLVRASLAKAEASMKEIAVVLDAAQQELARARIAKDAIPRKELEDDELQVQRLNANLQVLSASLSEAKEQMRLREEELSETRLLAPFAGTVTQIHIARGDTLRPLESPVMEIVALESLYAELLLPSSYIEKVQQNQKVRVEIENGGVDGKVIYVNPKIDAASRTFKVKIEIPNANGRIHPGMLAQVARFD